MAKWSGKIGFAISVDDGYGVWTEQIEERIYYGDVIRNSRRLQTPSTLNDNIVFNNEISIVANPFAYENFQAIRYATYMGTKWKVTNVDVQYPRLILSFGGVYNE